ncbi:MAG: hypothetical protein JWM11_7434 [Planctomycetaceae bacterium]|nr:hypothetical protein [Planctomycetaceae bacterium]
MRWWPYEKRAYTSPVTVDELPDRLRRHCATFRWGPRPRTIRFLGTVGSAGFVLVPVIWGQTSFMPQLHGRWQTTASGSLVRLEIVPSLALLLLQIVIFACLGILVYDRNTDRVLLATVAYVTTAWVVLNLGLWISGNSSRQQLRAILDASEIPSDFAPQLSTSPQLAVDGRRRARYLRWLPPVVVAIAGTWLCLEIYFGRRQYTIRPAVDLVLTVWITQVLLVLWLFLWSDWSPVARMRCLLCCFGCEVLWTWIVTLDGFAGDGRPILVWRWSPRPEQSLEAFQTLTSPNPHSVTFDASSVKLSPASSSDFPEFRGRNRDGIVTGVQLQRDWQYSVPQIIWQHPVGLGWSGFAIVNGFAVTQEQRGSNEAVVCYEVSTGHELWVHRDRAAFRELSGGDGPRATPTIHDGRVYSLGATGILNCLNGEDGTAIWTTNVLDDTRAPKSLFGMAGSPLIWKNLVIVAPGSPHGSLAAYDIQDGRRRWATGSAAAAYASPQLMTFGGREQVLIFNAEGLFAHALDHGKILWSYPWVTPPEFNNVCQPIHWIDPNGVESVFISSGYGKGCTLLEIREIDEEFKVVPRWKNTNLRSKFACAIVHKDHIYGLDENILTCLNLNTGQRLWKGGRYGYGQLLCIDRTLLVLSEQGEVVLCEATSESHRELARFPVLKGRTWNHPAIANDLLLLRNDRTAACVRLPRGPGIPLKH